MSASNPSIISRLAPEAHWHDHDNAGHVVQFYTEDSALLEATSRFIGTALGAGDVAVVIATKAHRNGLFRLLNDRSLDLPTAVWRDRYIAMDAAETLSQFMRDGWPDAELFASCGGRPVRSNPAVFAGDVGRRAGENRRLRGNGCAALGGRKYRRCRPTREAVERSRPTPFIFTSVCLPH